MKYHFLGDMECPSWLLEEVCTNFSHLTVLTFKAMCQQAAVHVIGGDNSSEFAIKDLSIIGRWLLLKPAGYECPAEDLEKEVVQLGLPPEHGAQLKKVYSSFEEKLRHKVRESIRKEPHATILNSTPTSFNMQSDGQIYQISMSTSMMDQLKLNLEKSLSQMKRLADQLPSNSD